jgi:hypothetical protein
MLALFGIPTIVVAAALVVTAVLCRSVWREGTKTSIAMVLSLVAMVPQASLCGEYCVRLITNTRVMPLEALSSFRLAMAWLLLGPILFHFSFRRSPRAVSAHALNVVRTGHVVGWTFSAPATLFTMVMV